MQTPLPFRGLFLAVLLAGFGPALSAQPSAPVPPLVVTDGKFTHDGKTEPATLGNLVAFVRTCYPNASITMIDVENVGIDHVNLQWRAMDPAIVGRRVFQTPLIGVLTALSDASGQRFEVAAFSDNDFVLRRPGGPPRAEPAIEVFNLKPLLARGVPDARSFEEEINFFEAQKAVLSKRPEKAAEVKDIEDRIQVVEKQRADAMQRAAQQGPASDAKKLLDQIPELVELAMSPLRADEELPKFKYHAGTNLLIVVGSPRAVAITRNVIDALAKNP